jgi:putrescine aminotransferase
VSRVLRAYRRHYNPSLARLFEASHCPVEIAGRDQTVVDSDGIAYLDFAAGHGVFGVGYCNPAVQAAVQQQLATMATAPPLLDHEPGATLIAKLASLLPGDLDRVVLAGSGSEAVEVALRAARTARPDRPALVAAVDSYHGKTLGALAVMGQPHLRTPFGTSWPDSRFVPHGDTRATTAAIGPDTAAVILEPVLGGGSLTVPPDGYLAAVRACCDQVGALLIADEVQTGFGRTGTMFAIDRDGIVPDVIVLSKAITGGHVPMAATVMREGLHVDYASDSAGSPLACAAANAAIDYIVEHDLPARAAGLGTRLLAGLDELAVAHPRFVREARGRGLMTGLQLRNRMVENALWLQLLKRRVVAALSLSRAAAPVLRLYPPLTVTAREIDIVLEALDESLTEMGRRLWTPVYDLGDASLRFQYRMPAAVLRRGARLIA